MASCDDDFSLLGDDNQTHHNHDDDEIFNPDPFSSKSPEINTELQPHPDQPNPINVLGDTEIHDKADDATIPGDLVAGEEDFTEAGFGSQANNINAFGEDDSNPFVTPGADGNESDRTDPNKSRDDSQREKRKDREELSDTETTDSYKKSKQTDSINTTNVTTNTASGGKDYRYKGESRKDREEWSETDIGILLDNYVEKFLQLNRSNLRGKDWEEVAKIVNENRPDKEKPGKSIEQCKNKVDNLKKRYKVELNRVQKSGLDESHWIWFKKMDQVVGSSPSSNSKFVSDEEKSPAAASTPGSVTRQQPKRSCKYPIVASRLVSPTNNLNVKSLSNPRWKRVVFKVSGAALAGTTPHNIDPKVSMLIAREVATACRLGIQVAIVVGGRNFFCGNSWVDATGLDRSTAYQIGMMSTVMNSILLQSALEKQGIQTRVQTAFPMLEVAEPYNKNRAIRHLEKGRVVIFGGVGAGSGNPIFTTDTAAALRASEIGAEALLKGTNVDGVYDRRSRNNNVAFEHISYGDLVSRGASPMDVMAVQFCEENGIPVVIFNLLESGNVSSALCGNQVGTLIDESGKMN